MQIIMNPPYYIMEDISHIVSMKKMIELLKSFVKNDEMLLLSLFENNVIECLNNDEQNFVNERVVFKNDKWVLPWESPFEEIPVSYWIKTKSDTDIPIVLRLNLFELIGVVVKENQRNFEELSYIIYLHEDEYDNYSVERLHIFDKRLGDFENNVLPKIKRIINNLTCITDNTLEPGAI